MVPEFKDELPRSDKPNPILEDLYRRIKALSETIPTPTFIVSTSEDLRNHEDVYYPILRKERSAAFTHLQILKSR